MNPRLFHNVEIWLDHSRYSLKPFFGAYITRKNEKILKILKKHDAIVKIRQNPYLGIKKRLGTIQKVTT